MLKRFLKDESGATMVEYGLIVALIAVVLITAIGLLEDEVGGAFNAASTAINGATP